MNNLQGNFRLLNNAISETAVLQYNLQIHEYEFIKCGSSLKFAFFNPPNLCNMMVYFCLFITNLDYLI